MMLPRQPTATRSASDRLNVESSRLLCDDGHSARCPAGDGKSQTGHGVDGWTCCPSGCSIAYEAMKSCNIGHAGTGGARKRAMRAGNHGV